MSLQDLEVWNPDNSFYKLKSKECHQKKFRLKSINPFSMLCVGRRGSGKSVFTKYLYKKFWKGNYNMILVFSSNIFTDAYDYIPSASKFNQFQPEVIERLFLHQENCKEKLGYMMPVLLILDDIADLEYSKELTYLYTMGRHRNISVVYNIQHYSMCNPTIRSNTDVVLILKTKGKLRDKVIEEFLAEELDSDEIKGDYVNTITYLQILLKKLTTETGLGIIVDKRSCEQEFYRKVLKYKSEL